MSKYALIGVAETPKQIADIFESRRKELGLTFQALDHCTGLQPGYSSKCLSPGKMKALGDLSMSCLLGALGLKIAVIADDTSIPKIVRNEIEREYTLSASMVKSNGSKARRNF